MALVDETVVACLPRLNPRSRRARRSSIAPLSASFMLFFSIWLPVRWILLKAAKPPIQRKTSAPAARQPRTGSGRRPDVLIRWVPSRCHASVVSRKYLERTRRF